MTTYLQNLELLVDKLPKDIERCVILSKALNLVIDDYDVLKHIIKDAQEGTDYHNALLSAISDIEEESREALNLIGEWMQHMACEVAFKQALVELKRLACFAKISKGNAQILYSEYQTINYSEDMTLQQRNHADF